MSFMQDDAKDAAKQKPKTAVTGTSAAASSSEPAAAGAAGAAADGDAEMADAEPSTSELSEAIQKYSGQPTGARRWRNMGWQHG